jgi:HAMP domain-containing protein
MNKKGKNLPRRKTRIEERSDYRKQLAAKQVSSTSEQEIPILGEINATDKIPSSKEEAFTKGSESKGKLIKTSYIISIIVGVLTVLTILSGGVYKFGVLNESINHLKSDIKELKQTINEKINRLEERIDKYISKEKSK